MEDNNSNKSNAGSIAAISLLDKYATLNTHIDKTRKEHTETESLIDNAKQEIYNIIDVERVQMKHEIKSILGQETKNLNIQKDKSIQNYNHVTKKEYAIAEQSVKDANNAFEGAKIWIKERRESFLESSRTFRLEIKRIKMDFLDEGKVMIPPHAFLTTSKSTLFDKDNKDGSLISLTKDNDDENYCNSFQNDDTNSNEKQNNNNNNNNDDEEMKLVKKRLKSSLKAKEEAEIGFKDAQNDYDKARTRTEDRKEKIEQGRSQLNRIRKDIEDMELELDNLDRETRELQMIGDTFQKGMHYCVHYCYLLFY